MIRGKQFYHLGSGEKRFKNVWMPGTLAHTPTHMCTQRKTKNTTSKHTHFAKHRYELMCTVKHTEQHPKDLISQSARGWRTPAAAEPFQNTRWEAASTAGGKQLRKSREKFSSWSVVVVSCPSRQGEPFLPSLRVGTVVQVLTDAGKASRNIIRPCVGKV